MGALLEKMSKTEFMMATVAALLGFVATKMGLSHDDLNSFFMFLGGVSSAYVGGRSYAKPREVSAGSAPAAPPLPQPPSA